MIEPTQVIKFSERLACLFYSWPRRAAFLLSNRTRPFRATCDPLFSIVSHPPSFPPPPDVRLFTSARILYLYSSLPPPLFFLFLSFFPHPPSSSPSDKSRGRSPTVLSIQPLSLSLSLPFLLLPVVAIYFTSLRRYRKLFAAPSPRPWPADSRGG